MSSRRLHSVMVARQLRSVRLPHGHPTELTKNTSTTNHIKNVAIVGAGGQLGTFITNALLDTGNHSVTAITHSQSNLQSGVDVKTVDYDHPNTIVDALCGQDALVVTISGRAPTEEIEEKLVRTAAEAGVPWILPNEWSPDTANAELVKDVFPFGAKVATRKLVGDIGKSSYLAIVTGFWYEYSLAIPKNYGFDFVNRSVTLFDEGETKISTSTWPQIGRAVAALLSLPIKSDSELCLQHLANQMIYINSFTVSQQDMLASVLRVTGAKEEYWTISKEDAKDRFTRGMEAVKNGDYSGFANIMCRVFFPDGSGDFEHNKGTLNEVLGLPKEDIDEATKDAIERQKAAQKQ